VSQKERQAKRKHDEEKWRIKSENEPQNRLWWQRDLCLKWNDYYSEVEFLFSLFKHVIIKLKNRRLWSRQRKIWIQILTILNNTLCWSKLIKAILESTFTANCRTRAQNIK
jgi:hypothetical protein